MPTYRDQAIVLRTHKLGEADRIVTVLAQRHGKVRAVAKGVRRTTSKFGGRLEPFSHVDLQFATGRTLDVITEAVTLHSYAEPLGQDYQRFTFGQVMIETADRLVAEEGQPAQRQYQLLLGGLHSLTGAASGPAKPASMVLDAYLLRSLAGAGYAPSLDDCSRCGAPGPHDAFAPSMGGMVCLRCRPPGAAHPSSEAVDYLRAVLLADWPTALATSEAATRTGSGLVAAFVDWHLERGLRTLSYLAR